MWKALELYTVSMLSTLTVNTEKSSRSIPYLRGEEGQTVFFFVEFQFFNGEGVSTSDEKEGKK